MGFFKNLDHCFKNGELYPIRPLRWRAYDGAKLALPGFRAVYARSAGDERFFAYIGPTVRGTWGATIENPMHGEAQDYSLGEFPTVKDARAYVSRALWNCEDSTIEPARSVTL